MSGPHRDEAAARLGMWLFLVTEFMLFGGLFLIYANLRHGFPEDFHRAGARMEVALGVLNTALLLTSSLTAALAVSALERGRAPRSMACLAGTLVLGLGFLAIKSLEWGAKFHHGLYPGSARLTALPLGEQVFIRLYFVMTGLHALHVIAGLSLFAALLALLARGSLGPDRSVLLANAGLFWHLVDVIWIFLLPLFYLAA